MSVYSCNVYVHIYLSSAACWCLLVWSEVPLNVAFGTEFYIASSNMISELEYSTICKICFWHTGQVFLCEPTLWGWVLGGCFEVDSQSLDRIDHQDFVSCYCAWSRVWDWSLTLGYENNVLYALASIASLKVEFYRCKDSANMDIIVHMGLEFIEWRSSWLAHVLWWRKSPMIFRLKLQVRCEFAIPKLDAITLRIAICSVELHCFELMKQLKFALWLSATAFITWCYVAFSIWFEFFHFWVVGWRSCSIFLNL